jgi:hypothetical protein
VPGTKNQLGDTDEDDQSALAAKAGFGSSSQGPQPAGKKRGLDSSDEIDDPPGKKSPAVKKSGFYSSDEKQLGGRRQPGEKGHPLATREFRRG